MTHEEPETAAQMYEEAAAELERAVGHCRQAICHEAVDGLVGRES